MSLDVCLTDPTAPCSRCGGTGKSPGYLFEANITHNLSRMADAAGIYEAVWRPKEIGITKAAQLIDPLTAGLALLKADPAKFEAFNAPNGWGLYEHFVPWVESYLRACEKNPEAAVEVCL